MTTFKPLGSGKLFGGGEGNRTYGRTGGTAAPQTQAPNPVRRTVARRLKADEVQQKLASTAAPLKPERGTFGPRAS